MSRIAYDLDGVFLPDYYYIPGLSMRQFYEQTLFTKPLFNPTVDFDIITARDSEFIDITMQWLSKLVKQPNRIYHDNKNHVEPWIYKAQVLKEHSEIEIYIESDIFICTKLVQMTTNVQILHFSTEIQQIGQLGVSAMVA